jgi:ABC-2 type transport system ATP-binding protein
MRSAAIDTERLSRQFGRKLAIQDIDLHVPEGAVYALVGANGAGKTTMIKVLMNLLRPSFGRAEILGMDSRLLQGRAFTRIGYVSENQEMPEWMTVGAMLEYFRPFYPDWDVALEAQLVRQLDLPLDEKISRLSRGNRMKAALASSLSYRPSLLVLDEPFSGLDPLVRDELIESLLDRAPETTIFLSSHDMAEIESFSTHIGFLEKGKWLFSEELPALSERFREVTITLERPFSDPIDVPSSWLLWESSDNVIRFIDSNYREDIAERELLEIFPSARNFSFDPMPLRSIFLAVAKSGREHDSTVFKEELPRRVEA